MISFLKFSLIVFFLWNVAVYAAALRFAFKRFRRISIGIQTLAIGGAATTIIQTSTLVSAHSTSPVRLIGGLALYAASQVLFWFALRACKSSRLPIALAPLEPDHIVNCGVFCYVRHPFYLAYALTWVGAPAAVGGMLASGLAAMLLCAYALLATFEEKSLLCGRLRIDYSVYRAKTGMFFPRISAYDSKSKKRI